MSVIPKAVIQGWYEKYEAGEELESRYPNVDMYHIMELAEKDRPILRDICLGNARCAGGNGPIYLVTAGAPLAGKTTILDQEIANNPRYAGGMALIDPDAYGMKFMVHTYHSYLMSAGMVAEADSFEEAQKKAYDIARPASNYLTLEMLNKAFDKGYDIAHGTTLTTPHAKGLLANIKNQGYEVHLLLCGAPDQMRADAAEYRAREQGNYQATPEDVISKGQAFSQRMEDYFAVADKLTLFWRDGVTQDAVRAAEYANGEIKVLNEKAYFDFASKHNEDRRLSPDYLPAFNEVEGAYWQRFAEKRPSPLGAAAVSFKPSQGPA